jgi:hypothetical protein
MDTAALQAWNEELRRLNQRRDTLLAERLQIAPAKSEPAPPRKRTADLTGFSGLTPAEEKARIKLRSENALRVAMGFDPLPEPEPKLVIDFGERRSFDSEKIRKMINELDLKDFDKRQPVFTSIDRSGSFGPYSNIPKKNPFHP